MVEFPLCLTGATAVIPASRVRIVPTPFCKAETNKYFLDRNILCSLLNNLNSWTLRGREQAEESSNLPTISAQKGECFSSREIEIKTPQICNIVSQSSSGFLHTVFNFKAAAKTYQTSQNRDIYSEIQNSSTIQSVNFFPHR